MIADKTCSDLYQPFDQCCAHFGRAVVRITTPDTVRRYFVDLNWSLKTDTVVTDGAEAGYTHPLHFKPFCCCLDKVESKDVWVEVQSYRGQRIAAVTGASLCLFGTEKLLQ
jgi:hypothetical protein